MVDDEDYDWLNQWNWYYLKKDADNTGYAMRCGRKDDGERFRKGILMHREILDLKKGEYADHIDGNGLNNCRKNLRKASNMQNVRNQRKMIGTSSKYKGVSWDKQHKRWRAKLCVDYKQITIGLFNSEEEASEAYNSKARELHGDFAKLNI